MICGLILFLGGLATFANGQCQIRLDHTPIVVEDLKAAAATFRKLGFVIKPGYLHKNGLLNSHIKFRNQTSIELTSITEAKDAIARSYLPFLADGEGGSFLSLRVDSIPLITARLASTQIPFEVLGGKAFDYVIFKEAGLDHIFFIHYKRHFVDKDSLYQHLPETVGINEVTLEGNEMTVKLLQSLGCLFEGKSDNMHRFRVENGAINIRVAPEKTLFRVTGIALESNAAPLHSQKIHGMLISR
jgi:hypothetical protein